MSTTHTCPVCGFTGLDEPARSRSGGGSYEICLSCDFQFGVTDEDRDFSEAAWRWLWIARGKPWSSTPDGPPPQDWDPDRQLEAIGGAGPLPDRRFSPGQRVALTRGWERWGLVAHAEGTVEQVHEAAPVYEVRMDGQRRHPLTLAHEDLEVPANERPGQDPSTDPL
ncbi:MAG: hypothetical protein WD232_08895 [Acidimicrobiales bacterium]